MLLPMNLYSYAYHQNVNSETEQTQKPSKITSKQVHIPSSATTVVHLIPKHDPNSISYNRPIHSNPILTQSTVDLRHIDPITPSVDDDETLYRSSTAEQLSHLHDQLSDTLHALESGSPLTQHLANIVKLEARHKHANPSQYFTESLLQGWKSDQLSNTMEALFGHFFDDYFENIVDHQEPLATALTSATMNTLESLARQPTHKCLRSANKMPFQQVITAIEQTLQQFDLEPNDNFMEACATPLHHLYQDSQHQGEWQHHLPTLQETVQSLFVEVIEQFSVHSKQEVLDHSTAAVEQLFQTMHAITEYLPITHQMLTRITAESWLADFEMSPLNRLFQSHYFVDQHHSNHLASQVSAQNRAEAKEIIKSLDNLYAFMTFKPALAEWFVLMMDDKALEGLNQQLKQSHHFFNDGIDQHHS